jgi:predicted nucleic acid-binding protein
VDKALLDTDILSEILRARDQQVIAQVVAYKAQHEQLTTSVVTIMEIVKGFHKVGRTQALDRFLQGLKTSELIFKAIWIRREVHSLAR